MWSILGWIVALVGLLTKEAYLVSMGVFMVLYEKLKERN